MVRKTLGLFSSSGDQQEQPFAQVNADPSIWIKSQRVAASSTGWRLMLMSFRARIRQMNRLVSGETSSAGGQRVKRINSRYSMS